MSHTGKRLHCLRPLSGMRAEAVAAVEEITGRQVAAYLTAHEPPDRAVIAFHFSPAAGLNDDR